MTSRAALALAVLVAASLFACAPRPLGAADMPHPRAGLWTWVAANGRGDFCSSGQPVHIPDSTVACPTVTYAKTDKGVEIDGVCGEGEVVSKIQMVFSGDFQSAYTVDTHTDLAIT
ncbi:MAG TPA: hypothetical protein VN806_11775, partial [Caulobacteraceae bacterium]|nr:hypothetical protein [Caulobacteraceae bacterium]